VLDLQLPDLDGLRSAGASAARANDTPILMLTARDGIDDRVQGLDAGADDYLVKPFALEELLARLRALLRRRFEGEGGLLRFGELTLDLASREAHRGERAFVLTRIEFDLLELFLRHPRQVLTREVLLNRVWGFDFDSGRTRWPSTSATCGARPKRAASRAAFTPCEAWDTCSGTRDLSHTIGPGHHGGRRRRRARGLDRLLPRGPQFAARRGRQLA
jgi:hypothetical protein